MVRLFLVGLGCSCGDGNDDDAPVDSDTDATDGAIVELTVSTPHDSAPLVRRVVVDTDLPSTLAVTFEAGDHSVAVAFPELGTHHEHLLLGFRAGRAYTVTAEATFPEGHTAVGSEDTTTAGPWPHLPTGVIVTNDDARRAPGYTMLPVRCGAPDCDEPSEVVLVFDETGALAYLLNVGTGGPNDTMQDVAEYDGGLLALVGTTTASAVHYAWDGTELDRWYVGGMGTGTQVQSAFAETFHHEVSPHPADPDHFLGIGRYGIVEPSYPASYTDASDTTVRNIADDVVLEFARDGSVVREMVLSDYVPTTRIGYDSLETVVGGLGDWSHTNSVQLDVDDGTWVIGLRHQDAVLKVNPDVPGEILWIAGYPDNWPPAYADVLLSPIGTPFAWQYHQHAPLLVKNPGGTQTLFLFDNGNAQTAPFSGVPELVAPPGGAPLPPGLQSRVVAFEIDPSAMTIRQLWSFDGPAEGVLFSQAVGDVDVLDNGNILSTWGFLETLPGGQEGYASAGLGDKGARVIEIDPATQDEVWHMHLAVDRAANEGGITAYRSERIQALDGRIVD